MRPSLALTGILVVFVAVCLTKTVWLPFADGPDEVAHFYVTRHIAAHGRLPLTEAERSEAGYKADLPPLYYLLVGLPGTVIDVESPPFVKISRDNPRLQIVFGPENVKAWRALTTEDPLRGEIRLWYWARWVSVMAGVLGLLGLYALLRVTQPDAPWLAVSGTALLAFLPTYTFISSVINYESLTGALMAGYLLLLYRFTQKPTWWVALGLGLLLGLAGATRQTVWSVIIFAPLVIVGLGWIQQHSRMQIMRHLALMLLGLSLTFGVWVGYMLLFFNKIDEVGLINGLMYPFFIGDGSGRTSLQIAGLTSGGDIGTTDLSRARDSLLAWGWQFFRRIWGLAAWVMLGVWLVALAGLLRRPQRLWLSLLGIHLLLLLSLPFVRFIFSGEASTAMAQHLLFPGGAMLILLLIEGLRGWLKPNLVAVMLGMLAAVYLGQTLRLTAQEPEPAWPIRTITSDAPARFQFETLSLLDSNVGTTAEAIEITLLWRADATSAEDYRVEISLWDEFGNRAIRWVGQPLNGRYPTRAWEIGEQIRDTITIPKAGIPMQPYQMRLRLLTPDGQPVLPAEASEEGYLPLSDGGIIFGGPTDQLNATDTVMVGGHAVAYRVEPGPSQRDGLPLFRENATILVSVPDPPGEVFSVHLLDPANQRHDPTSHTGPLYLFEVNPQMPGGAYALEFQRDDVTAVTPPALHIETADRQFEVGPISQPVEANFAHQVALLGYDLPASQVAPGDSLPVTLYWQALRAPAGHFIAFNHLVDASGTRHGGTDRLPRDVYSTLLWAPGEIVTDSFAIPIDPATPPGTYHLLVGWYLPVGETAVSLPLVGEDGQFTEVTSVQLGPITLGEPQP